MEDGQIANIVEMALLHSAEPLNERRLRALFAKDEKVGGADIARAVELLQARWSESALELTAAAGGWRFRTRGDGAQRLRRLTPERPPRLSRPLLEVLSVIAYHQPATRGDVEAIRGIAVAAAHINFLEECGWIEEVGRRETPGRPREYGTTSVFLDDLGLLSLADLPPLSEAAEFDSDESGGEEVPEAAPADSDNGGDSDSPTESNSDSETDSETEAENDSDSDSSPPAP